MKQTFKILILLIALITPTLTAGAQQNKKPSREELAEIQARHIASELAFDEQTTKQFTDTYCNCQKEIWALGPATMRFDNPLTEEQAREAIKYRFDHTQKVLDTRRKYYAEYSKFLTQLQIERVYQIEKQIKNRLTNRMKSNRIKNANHAAKAIKAAPQR